MSHTVPAANFVGTMLANLDNDLMSDADFRQFIRNTMPIVEKPALNTIASEQCRQRMEKYYSKEEIKNFHAYRNAGGE